MPTRKKQKLRRRKLTTGNNSAVITTAPETVIKRGVKPSLGQWGWADKPFFIAIHEKGYGVDQCCAKAIRAAQKSVSAKAKPTQLLIYRAYTEVEPIGFVEWPNGEQPILVGLTTTHHLWEPKRSLEKLTPASIRRAYEWVQD
jgi:hypothetical protein